jgi:hypothetical protein
VEGADSLLTTAEVAVALAGFAGIVVVLGKPSLSDWSRVDVLRLETLLVVSLGAVVFALVPIALHHAGLPGRTVIATSSALMMLYIAALLCRFQIRVRRLDPESRATLSPIFTRVILAVWIVIFVNLALNSLDVVFQREFGIYFLALLWFLIVSVIQFARIILVRFRDIR